MPCSMPERGCRVARHSSTSTMNAGRRTEPGAGRLALYSSRVLCRDRRRAQTYALSLNDDHGGAAETGGASPPRSGKPEGFRSEEHTSELQSLMRISYAVFCLKKQI